MTNTIHEKAPEFQGSIEELKRVVEKTGILGSWEYDDDSKYTFRSDSGGVLNWWKTTKRLSFQGDKNAKRQLKHMLSMEFGVPVSKEPQILVLHNYDTEAQQQIRGLLRNMGHENFFLKDASGEGQTLSEALKGKFQRNYLNDFAITLMTLDGKENDEWMKLISETEAMLPILLHDRMMLVIKGNPEIPSTLQQIHMVYYEEKIAEIETELSSILQDAGFEEAGYVIEDSEI